MYVAEFRKENNLGPNSDLNIQLLAGKKLPFDLERVLSIFFRRYAKSEKVVSFEDFQQILKDIGLTKTQAEARKVFTSIDESGDGRIQLAEFLKGFMKLAALSVDVPVPAPVAYGVVDDVEDGDDEDEEEEEVPDEFKDLPEDVQRRLIMRRSCWQMGLGTVLVLIFSDPMVDVLNSIGKTAGIPPFYVSFVLAPIASNASELVAAYNYALKKTSKTITISLNTLEGAANMNNTFCLGIFLGLIYFQNLAWRFTAETFAIIFVELVMAVYVMMKPVQTVLDATMVLMLYPLSLLFVVILEAMGLD
eukprot:NODE_11247_length_1299_cov_2.880546.p1 GENE.NODE_11247_length_1299_cov_2.880546~~NODE_11247_length_1299_cov_2.880546.p1  ORF type:complete len:337 (-),score=98.19 NODE_11247_length_1299_cov_2.880546:287-1201(-)